MKDELVIGRVRSAFGTAGEIKVESLSGESDHFTKLETLVAVRGNGRREFRVESVRTTHKAVLIKLEGVDTPEAAATLRGAEIVVPRSLAAPLAPGEYYYADLVDLEVTVGGEPVGRVVAIRETADRPLLEIDRGQGAHVLVPFANEFFGDVNVDAGRIELLREAVLE